jgi:hypothetical protein
MIGVDSATHLVGAVAESPVSTMLRRSIKPGSLIVPRWLSMEGRCGSGASAKAPASLRKVGINDADDDADDPAAPSSKSARQLTGCVAEHLGGDEHTLAGLRGDGVI